MFSVLRALANGLNDAHFCALSNIASGVTHSGYRIVMHMPESSSFKPKHFDSWKEYWEAKNENNFPINSSSCDCCYRKSSKFVGCHVIDIRTKEVFIYPACERCNSMVIQREYDYPFYAKKDFLVPFLVGEADVVGRPESPEVLLTEVLSSIDFDYFPPDLEQL